MSKRYTGGVVSSSLPTVNAAGASGVFTLNQQSAAQSTNNWPPYKIEKSLRFRSSASGYLNRTPSVAGNRRTWTWSGWVKRGSLSSWQIVFSAWDGTGGNDTTRLDLAFEAANTISITGGVTVFRDSTQVFRDPSAWYHIVAVADTTNATAQNRLRIYVNGVEITNWGTNNTVTQNATLAFNNNASHVIGARGNSPSQYFDGYMSEVNFIDGQALTPSSFGAYDKDGNWSPIAYTGTYGTNGFYLNFKDNTSATTMGYDYSGNGNNWTLNGFNVSTANTTYDIMIDVPEDQSDGTANNRGSYCTLNPLSFYNSQSNSINCTNGNLNIKAHTVNGDTRTFGTMGVSTGKWYFESNIVAVDSTYGCVGISDIILAHGQSQNVGNWWVYIADGKKYNGVNPAVGGTSYGNTFTTNDIIGIAVDLDNSKIWFSKNGTYQASGDPVAGTNAAFTNVAGTIYPAVYTWAINSEQAFNFGQRPFTYAPPSGFKSLNTFNLPEPTIKQPNKQFDVSLWTGNGSTQSITGLNFKPDLVWVKVRSSTQNHSFNDPLRGAGNYLVPNATAAERFQGEFTSFNSDGFSLTYNAAEGDYNFSGKTYVGWSWNAGGANTTNTSGSITSIVRANPTAGFSIATWTGNGSNANIGHGLGVVPSMIITKFRSGTSNWSVYTTTTGAGSRLKLNLTDATAADGSFPTTPTSSIFYVNAGSNDNGVTIVAYCFAPIAGYSAFGSYTGNGSTDGPFIFTGFRPRFVMIKLSSSGGTGDEGWAMYDTSRNTYNYADSFLQADSSNAQFNGGASYPGVDIVSNGVKVRIGSGSTVGRCLNTSSGTYIYAAFAEAPFKYSRSR